MSNTPIISSTPIDLTGNPHGMNTFLGNDNNKMKKKKKKKKKKKTQNVNAIDLTSDKVKKELFY